MIGPVYTPADGPCLDGLAERCAELAREPAVRAIAQALGTPARIVAWLCSLPQTDDTGIDWTPGAVQCGAVWQRTRSPADADDPNCWERLAWFGALLLVVRPDIEIRFSTWAIPGAGLHVAPMLRAMPYVPGWPLRWELLDLSPGAYPDLSSFVDLLRNAGPQFTDDGQPPLTDCVRRGQDFSARNAAAPAFGPPGVWYAPDSVVKNAATAILVLAYSGYPIDPRYVRAAVWMANFYARSPARNATTAQDFLGLNHVIGSIVLGVFGLGAVAALAGTLEQSQLPAWAGGTADNKPAAAAPAPAAPAAAPPASAPPAAGAAPPTAPASSTSTSTTTSTISTASSLGSAAQQLAAAFGKLSSSGSSGGSSSSSSGSGSGGASSTTGAGAASASSSTSSPSDEDLPHLGATDDSILP